VEGAKGAKVAGCKGEEKSLTAFMSALEYLQRHGVAKLKKVSQELLAEITRRLVAEFQPEQIILFGSHAWGEPSEDSDLDFLVIVPESQESASERAKRGHLALLDLDVAKDILVKTRAEFERYLHVIASLEHAIAEKGKRLYG